MMLLICNLCNKTYKYHVNDTSKIAQSYSGTAQSCSETAQNYSEVYLRTIKSNKNICKYCNHNFTCTFNLKRHLLSCKEASENRVIEENQILKQHLQKQTEEIDLIKYYYYNL